MIIAGTAAATLSDAATWRALAAFVLVAVVPGTVTTAIARRRASQLGFVECLSAGVAVGFCAWVLTAEILVRAGILTAAPLWILTALVAAISIAWFALDRRGLQRKSLGRHRTLRAGRPPLDASSTAGGRDPEISVSAPPPEDGTEQRRRCAVRVLHRLALRCAPLVPIALVVGASVPQLRLIFARPDSVISPTAWYYWLISQSFAAAGHVPASMVEWGQPVTTFTFHFGFSSSTAYLSVAGGDLQTLAPVQGVRLIALVLFVFGVWALTRALGGSTWCAAAVAAAAQYIDIYAIKLSSYRPESAAYGLALLDVALLIWAIRHRNRALVCAGVAGTVAANQIHAITAALALSLMVGVALVVLLFSARRLRLLRERLATLLSFAVPALGLTLAVNFIMIGQWSEGDAVNGLPDLGPNGFDPTWAFARLVGTGRKVSLPSAGYRAPDTSALALDSLQAHLYGMPANTLFVLCIALGAGLLITLAWSKGSRRLLVFSLLAFGCLLLISYLVSQTGDTYVPRRTGFSRLLQLWPVLPLVAIGAALGMIRWRFVRWAVSALLVAGSIVVIWRGHGDVDYLANGQPTAAQLAAIRSARIARGATVLTNGYTQGFVTLQTDGHGLLDGHAPYLEKRLLAETNTILDLARNYFLAPQQNEFPFAQYDVTYVLAAKERYALGTPVVWTAGLPELHNDRNLRLVQDTPSFVLYEVVG